MYGERIKLLRLQNNWTQQQLGDKIGYSQRMIGAIEAEQREPSIDKILEISKLFKVSTDFILGADEKEDYNSKLRAENNNLKEMLYNIYNSYKEIEPNILKAIDL